MNSSSLNSLVGQVIQVSRCDRWQAYQRLQELGVQCWCAGDGTLSVEVQTVGDAVQLRSVIQQLTGSRNELIDWLDLCWQLEA
uniref:Asr1405/Asl0597 family protein n=1 Tax=Trichocoleus desertorum TaxID=1481672 RepID=UPI0025B53E13|nr:Asr1405/Asl0597 family protein [Trichocoleus desertorum]